MALPWNYVTRRDLARGVDTFSARSNLPDGFAEDLVNFDTSASGKLEKRRGYEGYYGWVPWRVASVTHTGTSIQLTFADSTQVDFTGTTPSPLVIYGKLSSSQSGDFSTTAVAKYYSTFTVTSAAVLTVTDTGAVSASYTDTSPELTVWGLSHVGKYSASSTAGGHVTALDSYRRAGEERLVCGLGGVLFGAYSYAEQGTPYLMPSLRARCRATVNGAQSLAPLFHPSDPGAVRTRGVVYDASVSTDHYATVTAATYVSSGVVDYTLTWTSKTGAIADGGVLAAGYDKLTVSGLANPQHTGDWVISSVTSDAAGATVLRCANSSITSAHFDETGAAGKAGVFTDAVTTTAEAVFAAGDLVQGPAAINAADPTVVAVNSTTLYLAGITATTAVSNADVLYVTRTSRVVPLVNGSGTASVANMVLGDMLDVLGYDRKARVVGIRTAATASGTLSGSAGTVTVTQSSHGLVAGDYVTLTGVVGLSGTFEVLSAPTSDTFTVAGTVYSGTVQVVGTCVTLDESLEWTDAASAYTTLQAEGRWIPFSVPSASGTTPAGKATKNNLLAYAAYASQALARSTSLNDAVYVTNGRDPVAKFDGTSVYHAGLPRWDGGLFVATDNTSAILAGGASFAYTSRSTTGKYFVMDYTTLKAGDWVYDATADKKYLVVGVTNDIATEDYHVQVRASDDISASAATGTLNQVAVYKYYVRAVSVDANGYQTASAAAQSEDLVVDYVGEGSIKLKLVAPAAWGQYDWSRVQLEIYRTKANGSKFYLLQRLAADFRDQSGGLSYDYVMFTDNISDSLLVDEDAITSTLIPAPELGTGWTPPPVAEHITSLDNRLILGNIRGAPKARVVITPPAAATNSYAASKATLDTGTIITIRKDAANTSTTTNLSDVMRFQLSTTSGSSPTDFTFNGTVDTVADTVTKSNHGMVTGMSCTVSTNTTLPAPLAAATTYYIRRIDADTFSFYNTKVNACAVGSTTGRIDLTTNPAGLHTVNIQEGAGFCALLSTPALTFAANNALSAGNWIYLYHSTAYTSTALAANKSLRHVGWTRIVSATSSTFTIESREDVSNDPSDAPNAFIRATVGTDIPLLPAIYNYSDLNWAFQRDMLPVQYATGYDDDRVHLPRRLAAAINSVQRVLGADATKGASAAPWLKAAAGNDYGLGVLELQAADGLTTTPEIQISGTQTYADVYINDVLSTTADVAFESSIFPSRIVRSYKNYPELFDSPFASDAAYSDSIIDVNPADGQEITGMIPFFGDSATGTGSQLSQALLVFKTNSVYLVDVETRATQKLNTRGQGCTAPQSIAQTKDGVVFANASGVYRINRDMSCSPVGKLLKRKWAEDINRDELARAAGHHYPLEQVYKLSVPVGDDAVNSEVLVYDYEREGQGQEYGAWTTYDNHPAVWWCSLGDDSYFASTKGDVFKVRRRLEASDYRDDAAAISASATLRAEDFDLPGVRKAIAAVSTSVELPETDLTGLAVTTAANLSDDFVAAGSVTLDSSDLTFQVFDATPVQRRGTHIQVKYTHSTIDEGCVLAGVQYTVAPLSGKRVLDTGDA